MYYEDYATNLTASTDKLLHFLNLERKAKLPRFDSNKTYSGYFTQEEQDAASKFMKRIVSSIGGDRAMISKLGKLLERYFE